MQAADFFAMLPMPGAQAQGQGRAADAASGMAGLFGPVEGGFGLDAAFGDNAGFAEALLAVLAVAQPQQPQSVTPAPKGEAVDAVLDGARGGAFVPTLLSQGDAALAMGQPVDASAVLAGTPGAAGLPEMPAATAPVAFNNDEATPNPQTTSALGGLSADQAPAPAAPATETALAQTLFGKAPIPSVSGPASASAQTAAVPTPASLPAPSALPNGVTVTPVPDQRAAPEPAAALETVAPPPPVAAQAQVQTAPAPKPAAQKLPPGQAKAEPTAPSADARTPGLPSVAASVAQPEETLTETAVAAAAPVEAEEAAVADKSTPALPTVPAHAEARGLAHAPAFADAPKATPQTVAMLSAQIAKSLEGAKSTRFEVQLEPAGLGKVEVRVEIRPSGDIKADLSFESPIAAAELRARSGELQTALERAGFDSSKTQLSFNSGGQQGFANQFAEGFWRDQQQQQQHQGQSWRGAAFMDLADAPQNPAAAYFARERDGGVDVRI